MLFFLSINIKNINDKIYIFLYRADVAECGVSKRTLNPLIVGGTSYPPGEWPWLAALYHKNSKGVTFACSGSLLSSVHIVTGLIIINLKKKSLKI